MAYATSCPICGESDDEYDARISDPFGDCELDEVTYDLIVEALLHCLCFEIMWLFKLLLIKSGMDDDELDEAAAAAAVEKKDC